MGIRKVNNNYIGLGASFFHDFKNLSLIDSNVLADLKQGTDFKRKKLDVV